MDRPVLTFLGVFLVAATARGELPPGATLLDPAIVWDPVSVNSEAISPDGKFIAYVSKGALWTCGVTSGPPTKLTDLPETITDYLSRSDYKRAREEFAYSAPNPNYTPLPQVRNQILQFFNLQWTPSQDGVTYTLRRRLQDNSSLAAYRVMHASLRGVVTEIALIERSLTVTPDSLTAFRVTPDRRHVIVSNFGVPLIWDATANKPQATCFDYLLPSSTSGRLLGVEIDTRQLVLVDEDFHIVKRFDVTLDQRRRCDLFWSSDEQVAICRSYVEHPSHKWEGQRVDLKSEHVRQLTGGFQTDRFFFPGGGEVIRVGLTGVPQGGYADGSNGTFIELIPSGNKLVRDIYRFTRLPQRSDDYRDHRWYPSVIANSDCTLFAIALPRDVGQRRGYHFHLVDRKGHKWPFQPIDDSKYYTPYLPVAFANHDRTIVARNDTQLFSIPVNAICTEKEGSGD